MESSSWDERHPARSEVCVRLYDDGLSLVVLFASPLVVLGSVILTRKRPDASFDYWVTGAVVLGHLALIVYETSIP